MNIKDWLDQESNYKNKVVDDEFENKEGIIDNAQIIDTRYGAKLLITINFGLEKRVVFLGKKFAREFRKYINCPPEEWIGKRVKMVAMLVPTKDGVRKKLFPQPV